MSPAHTTGVQHFKHGWIPLDGAAPTGHRSSDKLAAKALGHQGTRPITAGERAAANDAVDHLHPHKVANDKEAAAYLSSVAAKLPAEQEDVVNRYTGDGFFEMNKRLRAGDASGSDIAHLDAAMRPLPHDLILSRTVGPEAFGLTPATLSRIEGFKGSVLADPAYQSTALGSPYGMGLGGINLKIAAPKGTPAVAASALSNNPGEREVLLGRGQKFAIASVVKNNRYGYDVSVVALPGGA